MNTVIQYLRIRPQCWCCLNKLVLWSLVFLPVVIRAADTSPKLTVQENSSRNLRFHIALPAPVFTQKKVDQQIYDSIQLEGFTTQPRNGFEEIPTLTYTVVLPPEGEWQVHFTTALGQRFLGKNFLLAKPDSLQPQSATITSATEWPPVRLEETGIWRGYRLGRLEILPLQMAGDELQFFSALDIHIEFKLLGPSEENILTGRAKQPISTPTNIEQLVLKSALNFPSAPNWRRDPAPERNETSLPLAVAPAIKMAIEAEGLYTVSYRMLDSLGLNPGALNPTHFQIWHKGREIPLRLQDDGDVQFEPGEMIEFFGERLAGEKSYFNHFTKQNIYWLIFAGEPGQRLARRKLPVVTATPANFFSETLHSE